ncbi:MAG: hypothetical protein QNI97_13640 [Desulfobacterales bacterium]|nr:hypothetical protein [Desulfobacterales bacterium]
MKTSIFGLAVLMAMASAALVRADPMSELIETLGSEYEALMPAPSGSVGTDYPSRQAALGSLYTARSIGLIYYQNQEMLSRQEALLNRYDRVIDQNRQIIRLLKIISEQSSTAPAETSSLPAGNPTGSYTE